MIVNRIRICGRPADIVKRQLSAVDSFFAPENNEFLGNQFGLDPDLGQLIGNYLANFLRLGISVRRKIEFDVRSLWIAGFLEQPFGLLWVVRIAFDLGIVTDHVRSQGSVHDIAVALINMLEDHRRIDGVIDRLAEQFIVKGLMGYVHSEKIHAHAFDLFRAHPRMVFESGQLFDGNVIDDIALSGEKSRHPAGILFDSFENDLLDRRFVAPVIVVSG